MRQIAVALGSNLGDRAAHLEFARQRLGSVLSRLRLSSVYETEPFGVPLRQPAFLNAAAVGESAATARELLDTLLSIERDAGRVRPHPGAARTLDLDLIFFGDSVLEEPGLSVPHPRFRERRFVLQPLAEIAPAWVDPVTGLTVEALLRRLQPALSASVRSASPESR